MLQRQCRRGIEQILKNHIESGRYPADQRVGQSPQQRGLAAPEKLVEDQHLAARPQNAGDFGKAMGRFRHHGQNQVQYGAIEACIGEGQALGIALHRREIGIPNAR